MWGGHPMLTCKEDSNIYLIKGSEYDVLVDSGGNASLAKLERNIRRAGSDPKRVREIWCTHSHLDHFVRAAHWIKHYPRVRCNISEVAIQFLKRKDYRLVSHKFAPSWDADFRVPRNLVPIREGTILRCPPFRFRVMALPGHVPDGVGFRGRVDGLDVLFSGDAAIGDQAFGKGLLGWIDGYWLSSMKQFQRTLRRLASKPPQLLIPGHGVSHYGPSARRSLRNCLRRMQQLTAFPPVCFLGPFADI